MSVDYQAARERMIETQLIPRGITDPLVLRAMGKVPRELFVPVHLKDAAYGDHPLPIGRDQTISQPYIVADMTQALELTGSDKVLEIGTGSGYQTAVIAELCREVYTVERIRELSEGAKGVLDRLGYANVLFKVENGSLGWPENSPYDAIIVTAGAPEPPSPLLDQLREGGRLVLPVGDRFDQILLRMTKRSGAIEREDLGPVRFVSLIGEHGWGE